MFTTIGRLAMDALAPRVRSQGNPNDFGGTWRGAGMNSIGYNTRAGERVNEDAALTLPAVFCAVWNLSSHIAMLKLSLSRRDAEDNRERMRDDPRDKMMNLAANAEMTAVSARSASMVHALLYGNWVSEIVTNGLGEFVEWWPLLPHRVEIKRINRRLIYEYTNPNGSTTPLEADRVLHVPAMTTDGVAGYPLIRYLARENIGLMLAIERYAQSYFGNGVSVGTVFTWPEVLEKGKHAEALELIRREYGGPENRGKPFLLHGGMTLDKNASAASNDDAQLIESLTWSVGDVARWLNIPPHFLKELSRATFSNIEHQGIDYVRYSLAPWARRIEQELNRKLVAPEDQGRVYFEHNLDTLLRGDTKTRLEFYKTLLLGGGLSPNAVLRLENMNSIGPAGDIHLAPLNHTTLERIAAGDVPEPDPGAPPPPPGDNPDDAEEEDAEASPEDERDAPPQDGRRPNATRGIEERIAGAEVFAPLWESAVARVTKRVQAQQNRNGSKPQDAILDHQRPKALADLWPLVEAFATWVDLDSGRKAVRTMAEFVTENVMKDALRDDAKPLDPQKHVLSIMNNLANVRVWEVFDERREDPERNRESGVGDH